MAWDNIISRGVWLFIQPSNFLFIILIFGFISLLFFGKVKTGKNIILVSLTIMFFAGFTNLSKWLLFPLEERFSQYTNQTDKTPYEGIIILGGSEKITISTAQSQPTFNQHSERVMAAVSLSRMFPALPVIHSGGTRRSPEEWSENDVAEKFFYQMGMDLSKIRFENKSYNTHSNALESKKLFAANETGTWLLVTSAFHMPRAVGTFSHAAINIQPYPVDYKTSLKYQGLFSLNFAENMTLFDLAIHEYIGLISYYVTDRSNSLFPAL